MENVSTGKKKTMRKTFYRVQVDCCYIAERFHRRKYGDI